MKPRDMISDIRDVGQRLASAQSVVVLTGAGISAESGLATFRDPDGLWNRYRPEDLANESAFRSNPRLVQDWYAARKEKAERAEPNAGHKALARLEQIVDEFLLVTQNVDGLHARAGSHRVVELHGSIMDEYCIDCHRPADSHVDNADGLRKCRACSGLLRPGVVWFGESLPADSLDQASRAAQKSDLFLSVGTSSIVYPAAGLPLIARESGSFVVEINVKPSSLADVMDCVLLGPAGKYSRLFWRPPVSSQVLILVLRTQWI